MNKPYGASHQAHTCGAAAFTKDYDHLCPMGIAGKLRLHLQAQ